MVFGETKTISQWKRCSGCNGIAPTGYECIENPKTRNPFKVSATPVPDLVQNRKRLFLQQKQNIEPQLMPVRKLYGFDKSFQSLDSSSSNLLHFGATIKVPSRLPNIQFYINAINTLIYFIINIVHDRVLEVLFFPTDDQVPDIFTKSLIEVKFSKLRSMLRVQ